MLAKFEFSQHVFKTMKLKVALVIVALVAVGLGIALVNTNTKADNDRKEALKSMQDLSNGWSKAEHNLEEITDKAKGLENDLSNKVTLIGSLSNTVTEKDQTIKDREAALKVAQEEKAKSDKRIAELEDDNKQLDAQTVTLTNQINSKNNEILAIQKKLDSSEGDKAFLEKELQRLMAEKADLERKFNDLAVLKDQVRKLKEELDVSRRLEWIREGLYANQDQKGAQKLMQGTLASTTRPMLSTNTYDLNVEVKSDGSVQVIQPVQAAPAPGDVASPK